MPDNLSSIGILDSGVGGVTVWAEITRLMPAESTYYTADTANCPYGGKSHAQIRDLTRACVAQLMERDVKLIVLACNSMSAASATALREAYPGFPFIAMEPAVKPAFGTTRSGVVGILATRATLDGTLYRRTLSKHEGEARVVEVAGDGLVELVEAGREESPEAYSLIRSYVTPMMDAGADIIVLGCTHYPFLRKAIDAASGGSLAIVDPAGAVARYTRQLLQEKQLLAPPDNLPAHVLVSTASEKESAKLKERAKNYIFTLQNG